MTSRSALPLLVLLVAVGAWALWRASAAPRQAPPASIEHEERAPEPAPVPGEMRPAATAVVVAPEPEDASAEREEVEPTSKNRDDLPEIGRGEAVLEVHVFSIASGQPIPGMRVGLFGEDGAPLFRADAEASQGRSDVSLVSDRRGRIDFVVPAGARVLLRACHAEETAFDAPAVAAPVLGEHEYRMLLFEVFERGDVVWRGRVVDRDSGEPLPEASVASLAAGRDGARVRWRVHAAADGRVDVRIDSTVECRLRADCPGYGSSTVGVTSRTAGTLEEQEIALARTAELDVLVLDEERSPIEGVLVTLSDSPASPDGGVQALWGYADEFDASGSTDARGHCALGGLPALQPLLLELRWRDRLLRRHAQAPLAAGERHELTFLIGAGTRLAGRLLDAEGRPLAGVKVVLVPGAVGEKAFGVLDSGRWVDQQLSDADGGFHFEDVPSGRWFVGVERPGIQITSTRGKPLSVRVSGTFEFGRTPQESDVACMPLEIELGEPAERVREIALTGWRGQILKGEVRSRGGEPVARAEVEATNGLHFVTGTADEAGRFVLGPLVPGRYRITAAAEGKLSPAVEGEPGASDVVLELE